MHDNTNTARKVSTIIPNEWRNRHYNPHLAEQLQQCLNVWRRLVNVRGDEGDVIIPAALTVQVKLTATMLQVNECTQWGKLKDKSMAMMRANNRLRLTI